MRGKIIALLISAVFLLVGCGSKGTSNNTVQATKTSTAQSNTDQLSTTQTSKTQSSTTTQTSTNGQTGSDVTKNSNYTKSKSTKALTEAQKSEVKQKVGTAIDNVNNALQSIQNVPDVDISEANK